MENRDILTKNIVDEIEEKHSLQGIQSVSTAAVIVPENMRKIFNAAFDSRGVTIYDIDEDEQLVEFGAIKWDEFPQLTIKHFKGRSVVSFYADDRFRRFSIIDGNGESIESFLKEHTPVDVNVVELKWYNKIPGFRSETRWKMITSSIVYLWIIGTIYNLITS